MEMYQKVCKCTERHEEMHRKKQGNTPKKQGNGLDKMKKPTERHEPPHGDVQGLAARTSP